MSRAATWAARAAALVTLASLLAACHTTRVVWAKPGGDNAALQDDMQACNYQPTATAPGYQAAAVAPSYQPTLTPGGYQASPTTPAYSGGNTKLATIDVQDAQRLAVSCMIAHGWRLTPLP